MFLCWRRQRPGARSNRKLFEGVIKSDCRKEVDCGKHCCDDQNYSHNPHGLYPAPCIHDPRPLPLAPHDCRLSPSLSGPDPKDSCLLFQTRFSSDGPSFAAFHAHASLFSVSGSFLCSSCRPCLPSCASFLQLYIMHRGIIS